MTTPESPLAGSAGPPVEVRRSKRRRRTVQAYLRDDTVVVLLPARMTKAEERFWVAEMVGRLERQEQRRQRRRNRSDAELLARSAELSKSYLDGRARPAEVRWVTNQNDRWGSCTPAQGRIRLSARLRDFPGWVTDYVLVHELTHLLEPGHGPEFWRLVNRYPKTERARGYLEGVLAAAAQPTQDDAGSADAAECAEDTAAEPVDTMPARTSSGPAADVPHTRAVDGDGVPPPRDTPTDDRPPAASGQPPLPSTVEPPDPATGPSPDGRGRAAHEELVSHQRRVSREPEVEQDALW